MIHTQVSKRVAWQTANELNSLLPSSSVFKVRGSIDRFGFLHLLAEQCCMRAPKRAFAEWMHGWIWDDRPTIESLAMHKLPRDVPVVVRNKIEQKVLLDAGFRDVWIGGLPFCYVPSQHKARNGSSLLAIPPHSAEAERVSSVQRDYMDFLESLKGDFDDIYVCIFYLDWDGPMHRAALQRGLRVVQGARPDDAYSLKRVRALFEAFEHVTSNSIGSHFVYALYSGSRFSFCGPMFTYDEETILANGNPNGHSEERVRRLLEIQDPRYLQIRFGKFYVDHPRQGAFDTDLGASEIGTDQILSPLQIKNILGWTVIGQLCGYGRGAFRRLRRATMSQ